MTMRAMPDTHAFPQWIEGVTRVCAHGNVDVRCSIRHKAVTGINP